MFLSTSKKEALKGKFDKYFNLEMIRQLNLSNEEKNNWKYVVKYIYEQEEKCKSLSRDKCYNSSFIHIILKRNFKTKQLYLSSFFCPKKNLLSNYLIREFPNNKLLLSFSDLAKIAIKMDEKKINDFLLKSINNNTEIGLYLYGTTGIGKTHKIISYCNEMIYQNKKKIAYIFLPQFVGEIKNNFSENPSNNKTLITNCCVADILVLDDFGAEYASAWFYLNILLIIFNYRFENDKKIIFISNFEPKKIAIIMKKKLLSNSSSKFDRENIDIIISRLVDRMWKLFDFKEASYITKSRRTNKIS